MENRGDLVVYVGARTTRQRNARGNGLNVYRLRNGMQWEHLQLLEMENPSFLAFDRTGQFLHTVHGDSDRVTSFAIERSTGKLKPLGTQSTRGRNPVDLSFDPTNRYLVIANHVTSSIVLLPRLENGALGEVCDLAAVTGEIGPHRVEQAMPKPHQVKFDPSGRWIAVPDKGADTVLIYKIDAVSGTLRKASACATREASGPRHIAFHSNGRLAYVVNELDSTVTAYRFDPDNGRLSPFQILSTLPDTFTGNSRAAEIAVSGDGRFVYASNRGSDTIVVFELDRSGHMRLAGHWATGGKTPRFFTILPNGVLLAANEDSDTVTAFDIDAMTGRLSARDEVLSVGSPVCIVFKALD
ncbi:MULTISPECIES: lactonase family protein [Rhizobium/Agrobacterium group]|uniref:lactonase family protein n=1 Tax=Rhizobium/Agrobacterium group TaxID=227290 RepID=UPI000FD9DB72|nr:MULTISPECIES: lactonase family protein [Rhizobium/Agrobacterium group]MBB4401797.1 6-phosphogluconolactonase (cycloisomerase 2 family) [Agrobacterium radiobacter]MBB5587597.1 6-phosphogluconolactonase (cycloisomerase 2 family) [Agrobacterium radiobacter]RVT81018.1 lactonase family protein [Agrobacterium sp. CNPSo 2736]TGE90287.1 hemagglutinin [Rhizobium sp. SEMIA 4032]